MLAARAGAIFNKKARPSIWGRRPGRIVFASAADSELAALAASVDRAGVTDLRLASLMRLSHNLSVDLWLDNTVRHANLIVVRLLGGAAYWSYGVDEICRLAEQTGARLALLPGDANPDPALLLQRSSVSRRRIGIACMRLFVRPAARTIWIARLRRIEALASGARRSAGPPRPTFPGGRAMVAGRGPGRCR